VLVDAVEEEKCADCGSVEALSIPKLGEMLAAAAVLRATMPPKLRGPEVKALRKALGMNARVLAQEHAGRDPNMSLDARRVLGAFPTADGASLRDWGRQLRPVGGLLAGDECGEAGTQGQLSSHQ